MLIISRRHCWCCYWCQITLLSLPYARNIFFRQIEKWNVLFEESSSNQVLEWWMEIQYISFFSLSLLLLNGKLRKYLSMMNWKYIFVIAHKGILKMSRKWNKFTRVFFYIWGVAKQAFNFYLPHHGPFLFIR